MTVNEFKILIINVYLPYQNGENYELFLEYLGKIESVIENFDLNGVIVIGDLILTQRKIFIKSSKGCVIPKISS